MKPMLIVFLGGVVSAGCAPPSEDAREPSPAVSSNKYAWIWWRDQAVASQAQDAMVHPSLVMGMHQEPTKFAHVTPLEVFSVPAPPTRAAAEQGISDWSRDLEAVMQELESLVERSFAVQQALLRLQLQKPDKSKPGDGERE